MQGEGFQGPASCVFSNGTLVQTVTAKVDSPVIASCTVPSWPLLSLNGTNGDASSMLLL